MRVVNRIVNILVLVFAIAAVVFSYLLFNSGKSLSAGGSKWPRQSTKRLKIWMQNPEQNWQSNLARRN